MLALVVVQALCRTVFGLIAVGAVAGCSGNPLYAGGDGGSAGHGGSSGNAGRDGSATPPGCGNAPCAAGPCDMLLNAQTCAAQSGCTPVTCSDCKGGQFFAGCEGPGERIGCTSCPVPPPCSTLDETKCKGRSDCRPGYCSDCKGGQTFQGCAGPNEGVTCVDGCPAPPSCDTLDQMACAARSDCQMNTCPACGAGQTYYAGCGLHGTAPSCAPLPCPDMPSPCGALDEMTCNARGDCHAVFGEQGVCNCKSVGCCTTFLQCREGGKAACNGPTEAEVCTIPPPACEAPGYVISYTPNCYEGCVRPSECGP